MKKLENLGRKLGKAEQKKIMGGPNEGGGGTKCSTTVYCGEWVGGATGHWVAGTCSMSGLSGLPEICTCDKTGSSDECTAS